MFNHPLPLTERLRLALDEDIRDGDVTASRFVSENATATAHVVAKQSGVFSGGYIYPVLIAVAGAKVSIERWIPVSAGMTSHVSGDAPPIRDAVRKMIDEQKTQPDAPAVSISFDAPCPAFAQPGDRLMTLKGPARLLLSCERVGLNLIARMSGIATLTRQFVDACLPLTPQILCTRKTTPLWRDIERQAVLDGGGALHRAGLYDMALIKENHLRSREDTRTAAERLGGNAFREKVSGCPVPVEIEVETLDEFRAAMDASPDYILLDNMDLKDMTDAVAVRNEKFKAQNRRPLLEASGNVSLTTIAAIARTGVERISVGSLTHSAKALDLSLLFEIG
ncbi:MAG: nicotinate-nucleotide diphosphorylase [Planctomycetota bacterium]